MRVTHGHTFKHINHHLEIILHLHMLLPLIRTRFFFFRKIDSISLNHIY